VVEIKPFRALRPKAEFISTISCLPYDVVSRKEAADVLKMFPDSFLKVVKPESTVPIQKNLSPHGLAKIAARNLNNLKKRNIMVAEQEPCFYIYQQSSGSYQRTGIVTCLSVKDYQKGLIKKHEKIRIKTWQERVQHIQVTRAHTGCALIFYRSDSCIEEMIQKEMSIRNLIYDFVSDDGVRNCCWRINQDDMIIALKNAFRNIHSLYIADGHHRIAAAAEVNQVESRERKSTKGSDGEYAYFPAVLIPDHQINILGYHRLIKNIHGFSPDCFLQKLGKKFKVEKMTSNQPFLPFKKHEFGMNLADQWYQLSIIDNELKESKSMIDQLDVSILQNQIINPLLSIINSQESRKINFIGGKDVLSKLSKNLRQGTNIVFTLYPTSVNEVMKVADNRGIMPPKSTWFEPKLRSGIFVHLF